MDLRTFLRLLATLAVLIVVLPIAGDILATYADRNGLFDDPSPFMQYVQRAAIFLTGFVYTWWYPWVAGYIVGFGFGVWTESVVRLRHIRRAHLLPDRQFDFEHFGQIVAKAKELVEADIQANGLGRQPRVSMDAANEVLAVMLYLAKFGIRTPMRGDYSHTLIQTFLVRSMHYLSMIGPAIRAGDVQALRRAQDAKLVDRQSQLIEALEAEDPLEEATARLVNA